MYKEEDITFDKGWNRIKSEFIDRIENNLEKFNIEDTDHKFIKLKAGEYITYYKLVYDMCTQKDSNYSELLYNHLGQSLTEYIKNKMCTQLETTKSNEEQLVSLICEYWMKYKIYANVLKGIFCYLDRFYVPLAVQPTVHEYAMAIFQKHVFDPYKLNIKNYLLELLDNKRSGEDVNNNHVSTLVEMYNTLDSTVGLQYKDELEPSILERCSNYYNKISTIWLSELSLMDYIYIIQYCVDDELEYSNKYLNNTTSDLLYNTILASLLYNQQDKINNKLNDLTTLFENYQLNDLKLIYKFVHNLTGTNEKISNLFKDFMSSKIKPDDFNLLTKLYNKYLYLITFSFDNNNYILNVYNNFFKNYVNDHRFVNELLAFFHNHLSLNNINEQSDKSDPGNEVDEHVNMYNLIDDKNGFMTTYKMKLGYRLLNKTSDVDYEFKVLNKLSNDEPIMNHLYKMLDDVKKSYQLYEQFSSMTFGNIDVKNLNENDRLTHQALLDSTIVTVSNIYWPISTSSEYQSIKLNQVFTEQLSLFEHFFTDVNKFKNIQYSYEHSIVEINYYVSNSYEENELTQMTITCNMLQASLLLLFNKADRISLQDVMNEMNLEYDQLVTIVNTCDNLFLLLDDTVVLNYDYLNNNQQLNFVKYVYEPLLLFSVPGSGYVGEDMSNNRLFEKYSSLDALIVRIMKKYKKLSQSHFMNILQNQMSSSSVRVPFNEQVVMDRIKNLVNKDYLNQVDDQLVYIP